MNILIIESEKETVGEDRIDQFFTQNNLYQQDIDQIKIVTQAEARTPEVFDWVCQMRPLVITEDKDLLTYLTGRQSESIPYFLGAIHLHIGQFPRTEEVLSIKHLVKQVGSSQLLPEQKQIFQMLGELIK